MDRLTITQPDDFHLHLRTGDVLQTVIGYTARQFARAMIMPNLQPPVTTVVQALRYRTEIMQALPDNSLFQPLMTLYLTDNTDLSEVKKLADSPWVFAFKLYPAGATTHSEWGVSNIKSIYSILAELEKQGIPLLIHGEVTSAEYDVFDREKIFIDKILTKIIQDFPALRIVLEHLTTAEAVEFVGATAAHVGATITPQHLMFNRNALFVGGIKPHFYCLPVLKREHHRRALVEAATSGNPKFFLGTDSAPHLTRLKESSCGCAGCFTAHAAMELYATVFEEANALDKLEGFASFFGADFYGLDRNKTTLTLQKKSWQVPEKIGSYLCNITPLLAGETLAWQVFESVTP